MPRRSLLLALSVVTIAGFAAGIYKWVDEKGVTHYSDAPVAPKNARSVPISPPPAAAPNEARGKSWQQQEREFRDRQLQRAERERREAEDAAAASMNAAMRRERCIRARQNLHALQTQRAVYFINEKGEREYLDDAQRAATIERVMAEIAASCESQ